MKKIGLVTYYKSYNYGVWLQAFSTLRFLKNRGYDAELIAYSNPYEDSKLKYAYKEGGRNCGYITSFLKSILFGKVRYYKKGFKRNMHKYYSITDREFSYVEEMQELKYDVLAVGSDQVWNPEITNGLEKAFLLEFGKADKRISIASSLGSKPLAIEDKKRLAQVLNGFDAVSVRENFAKECLQPVCRKEIKVLADPTFLLSREEWIDSIAKESKYYNTEEKYILTYFVSKDKSTEKCINLVRGYGKGMGLPVWAVQFSSYFSEAVERKILGASIGDFIALIMNAQVVITDSFHGAALSINMKQNFVACVNSENPVRTENLLSQVDLLNRINMEYTSYEEIDYSEKYSKVEALRNDSQEWIVRELER